MGETDHGPLPGCRRGIKGGGFHLDGEDARLAAEVDRLGSLPKWRVGRPGRTTVHAATGASKCSCGELDQSRVGFRVRGGREIMIAGALVSQSALDQDVVGRPSYVGDLPGGRDIHQQLASGHEELRGDRKRKRAADDMPDDAETNIAGGPFPHPRVEAGPALAWGRSAHPSHVGYNVAIRIDHADRRHSGGIERFLPAGFPQRVLGAKYRWGAMVLALEERCGAGRQLKRRPTALMVLSVHVFRPPVSAPTPCPFLAPPLLTAPT